MTLITSISGIRGTIGGKSGDGLSPEDILKFTSAYGNWLKSQSDKRKVIIGRDGRISGEMVTALVKGTLMALGFDVYDCGLSTTPTVEMMVPKYEAAGGIILTASHNPKQWNALKLLNQKGEFISASEGNDLLEIAKTEIVYSDVDEIGKYYQINDAIEQHIEYILDLELVDVEAIKAKNFTVAVDAVHSTGGIAVPMLLEKLGVENVHVLYGEVTGKFPHNPEPLPEHLTALSSEVIKKSADIGFAVDPDVDRLAMICEDGEPFGEEYTLVAVSDYILKHKKGNTVSNLSSTRALRDVTEKHGQTYYASAVGEVNVVEMMKAQDAIIGGEGNGGIIYPELHYGRDALVGIALILSQLAKENLSSSMLRGKYPNYFMTKSKIQLSPSLDLDGIFETFKEKYKAQPQNTIDGLKIEFDKDWVHLRKSNTEPIIRIYAESSSQNTAQHLVNKIKEDVSEFMKVKA